MSVIEEACGPVLVKRKFTVPLAPSETVRSSCASPMPQLLAELDVMQSNEKGIAACAVNAAVERTAPTRNRAQRFTKSPWSFVLIRTLCQRRRKVHARRARLAPKNQLLGLDIRFLHHAAPFRIVGLDLVHRLRRRKDLGVAAGGVDARDEVLVGAGFGKRAREPLERFARQAGGPEEAIPRGRIEPFKSELVHRRYVRKGRRACE